MPRKERIKTTTTKTTTPKMLMPFLVPSPPEEVCADLNDDKILFWGELSQG